VEETIAKGWGGDIEIEDVRFRYSGLMDVARVGLHDSAGREIVELRGMSLRLGNWPSRYAAAVEIRVSSMDIRLPSDGNGIDIPLKKREDGGSTQGKRPRLEAVDIDRIKVVGERGGESRTLFSSLSFELTSEENLVKFSLRDESMGSEDVRVEGQVARGTSGIDVTARLSRFISRDEAGILLPLLGAGERWSGAGRFVVGIKFAGDLSDVDSVQSSGIVRLSNWSVYKEGSLVAEGLSTTGRVNGRRIDFEECRGQFCGGLVSGKLWCEFDEPNGIAWGGDIFADQLDNDDLVEFFGGTGGQSRGQGSMRLEFELAGTDRRSLQATGSVFLTDADMGGMPLVRQVFSVVGMSAREPLKLSDAAGEFVVTDGILLVERAEISNEIGAVEVEKGGTLDLVTGDVDIYAVGILLKHVRGVVRHLPVIRLFQDLKDKLVRVHVEGNISQPVKRLVRKEPVEDVAAGTFEFIFGVAETGGNLTDAMLRSLGFMPGGNSKEQDMSRQE
jgi:hypothetical protein